MVIRTRAGRTGIARPVMFQILNPRFTEFVMTRTLASTLTIVSTAAAACAFAAIAAGNAYADDITVETTPFVSTRTRADVQAEVMGQAEQLRIASSDWSLNQSFLPHSGFTRAQAKSDYIAARREVNAMTAEDSGSSYLASLPRHSSTGVILAGSSR